MLLAKNPQKIRKYLLVSELLLIFWDVNCFETALQSTKDNVM